MFDEAMRAVRPFAEVGRVPGSATRYDQSVRNSQEWSDWTSTSRAASVAGLPAPTPPPSALRIMQHFASMRASVEMDMGYSQPAAPMPLNPYTSPPTFGRRHIRY